MSQENVEIVCQSLDAYSRRDIKAMRALNDPDLELDWSASRGALAGIARQRGRGGIEVSASSALVFTLRGNSITRVCLYQELEMALESVGLTESERAPMTCFRTVDTIAPIACPPSGY